MKLFDDLSREMKMLVGAVACLVTFGGLLFAGHNYFDDRYALAESVKQIGQRLDQKIVSDQLNSVQQRIWLLEDRYKSKKMDQSVGEEYRILQEQKRELSEQLKKK